MSTKSSLYYHEGKGDHKIDIHIYEDMHEIKGTVVVDISCSTCYCRYQLLMNKHLATQLVRLLRD